MMKKLLVFVLCLMFCCTSAAFASSEADQYLVDKIWEMNVGDFSNTEYFFFGRDGYGFWFRSYAKSSGQSYYFKWETFDGYDKSYITIEFKDQDAPINGWSLYNNPHKENTYWLLWNPDFMYMIDRTHEGTNIRSTDCRKDLHIFNGTVLTPYMVEQYTNEANNAFAYSNGGTGGGGGGSW